MMLDLRRTPQPLPRFVGWAALGVLVAFTAAGTAHRLPDRPVLALAGTALAVGSGGLALFGPRQWLLPGALGAGAGLVLLGNGSASTISWFGVCVLTAMCTMNEPLAVAIGFWLAAVLVLAGQLLFTRHDPGWAAWIGGATFSLVGSYAGIRQHELVTQLREAQAGLAAQAQARERTRIARELHDVIAHSLTVSLMHVTGARLAVRDDPADAERALAEAERLGRASLDEVRHVVGALRTSDERAPTTPQPGSTDLPGLIEQFRRAGADVVARFDGDLSVLPGTVGLAVYRIVQESLTNAAKHTPDARATVRVAVGTSSVELDVDTAGTPGPGPGVGLGLVGMRERAEALGGCCTAGPGGNGWLVHAELPIGPVP